jgi:hemerythrin superfamily protein
MDAIELLEHDHRMVEQLLRDYPAARSDTQRRGLVEILVRELSKHAALEELLVYPLANKLVGETADVDTELEQHMALKKTLLALDELEEGSPLEKQLIAELEREVTEHVAQEEGHFLPALRAAMDDEALVELGKALDEGKATAPTRPHPKAPDHPPALALAAPVAALYDRLRDRIQGRDLT